MGDSTLLIDYVYLDSEERKRFAQASHEYLIEQLQFTGSETFNANTNKFRLNFNHPSKYLIWVAHLAQYTTPTSQWLSYATDASEWRRALDDFAVLICAASSDGLIVGTGSLPKVTTTDGVSGGSGAASNTLVSSSKEDVSDIMTALLPKVDVNFVSQGNDAGATLLASSGNSLLDNAIVVRNELTVSDITCTVAELLEKSGVSVTGAVKTLLTAYGMTVVDYFNYGLNVDGTGNPCVNAKIQLNGHDRFTTRDGNYFNYVQPYQHFSNTPSDGVNVYSFALKAEDHQPTGTCNFSRIDNATLNVNGASSVGGDNSTLLNIYTVNYNVLRVMSGMAGTAYSN
jgi:hypothetical protein